MAKSRKDNKGRALRKGETQRKDGMYEFKYRTPEGVRRSIYSKDIRKLREREDKIIKDTQDGLNVYTAGHATVNAVFDRYIATKAEIRETTMSNYRYMYDRFVRDGFGKRKIGEVKYSDVLQFYLFLLSEKGLQINTLEIIHTLLNPTFAMAVKDDVIRKNPFDGVMAEIKKKSGNNSGVRHALTMEQQMAFVKFLVTSVVFCHWKALFIFLLGTGCRIGEAIGIRWEDLDFKNRLIHINHSVVYYSREYQEHKACSFAVSLPKTDAGIRTIPMLDEVYEVLQEELQNQQENGFIQAEVDGMTGFVFGNRFGNLHNPQTVNRAIKRIYQTYNAEELVKAAKEHREPILIPHFSCHHLRHTFCTRLCEVETNLKVVQSIMGHADIETTMDIYAEVSDMMRQKTMGKVAHEYSIFGKEFGWN